MHTVFVIIQYTPLFRYGPIIPVINEIKFLIGVCHIHSMGNKYLLYS